MKKFTTICLTAILAVFFLVQCNSTEDYTFYEDMPASVAVNKFALSADVDILSHLDTIYFSIDLAEGKIFNADSLPYGTPVNKLVPKITMAQTASMMTLIDVDEDGNEESHDYLSNPGDTIDFTQPVRLDVTSGNGLVIGHYTITINVHKVVSDSLVWDEAAKRTLPTTLTHVNNQRTTRTSAGIYCLTTDRTNYCMAFSDDPFADSWTCNDVTLPAGADIETFNSTDDALFVLADGELYKSTDGGASWTDTGCRWDYIYGSVDNVLLGNVHDSDGWKYTDYPASALNGTPMPEYMPVRYTSQLIDFSFPMSSAHQAVMVGGYTSNYNLTGSVWFYDGSAWARVNGNFAKELYGVTIVPFYTYKVSNTWVATKEAVILAMGGMGHDDEVNNVIYMSHDYGMTWTEADSLMQQPDVVRPFFDAQGFVETTVMTDDTRSRSAIASWTPIDLGYRLPASAVLAPWTPSAPWSSRAIKPENQWSCPFIYVFGGRDNELELQDQLWRVTISRLTFKPIL